MRQGVVEVVCEMNAAVEGVVWKSAVEEEDMVWKSEVVVVGGEA
jgi:hypothetical protein